MLLKAIPIYLLEIVTTSVWASNRKAARHYKIWKEVRCNADVMPVERQSPIRKQAAI